MRSVLQTALQDCRILRNLPQGLGIPTELCVAWIAMFISKCPLSGVSGSSVTKGIPPRADGIFSTTAPTRSIPHRDKQLYIGPSTEYMTPCIGQATFSVVAASRNRLLLALPSVWYLIMRLRVRSEAGWRCRPSCYSSLFVDLILL